jgi:hypothetical protein
MRFTTALAKLRELLENADTAHWTDLELGTYLNRQAVSLTRKMAEIDEGYHNFQFSIPKARARQIRNDVWEYPIPSWVMRVVEVRVDNGDGATGGAGDIIRPIQKYDIDGWLFSSLYGVQLKGRVDSIDLDMTVVKRPAMATSGVLPAQTSMSTLQMRMDADTSTDALNFPHETLENSYANALVEITGQSVRSGQIRRVLASSHFQNLAGTLYTQLTLDRAWDVAPAAADTYAMHLEIPEEHMMLVLLLAARQAWTTKGHYDEVKASAGEIMEQQAMFVNHMRPRQIQEPKRVRAMTYPSPNSTSRYDQDAYYGWTW